MNKLIITILVILTLSSCSITNKYDAEVAKARYEYGKQVNERKPMFEIKGELRCSEAQISASECGLVVYNQNQRYINVDPQSPDRFGQILDFTGKLINPLFNWKIAQSNNDLSRSLSEQNTELFSNIFNGVAELKGTGTNYTYNDSYNSQDTSNVDSFKTTSSTSTVTSADNSYNQPVSSVADSYNSESTTYSSTSTSTVTEANDNNNSNTTNEDNPIIP